MSHDGYNLILIYANETRFESKSLIFPYLKQKVDSHDENNALTSVVVIKAALFLQSVVLLLGLLKTIASPAS